MPVKHWMLCFKFTFFSNNIAVQYRICGLAVFCFIFYKEEIS